MFKSPSHLLRHSAEKSWAQLLKESRLPQTLSSGVPFVSTRTYQGWDAVPL